MGSRTHRHVSSSRKNHGPRCRKPQWQRLELESLEPRVLLTASVLSEPYLVPQQYLMVPNSYLTASQNGDPLTLARSYLEAHARDLGLTVNDLLNAAVTSQYQDPDTGLTHLYFAQTLNQLQVENTSLTVTVTANGQILNVAGGFYATASDGSALSLPGTPAITADAAARAASAVGLPESQALVISSDNTPAHLTVMSDVQLSLDPINARLAYLPTAQGLRLVWDMTLRTPDNQHWYDMSVDAQSGEALQSIDWVDHASYNVYALPTEGPNDGTRSIVTNPQDAAASPYGWHDTNGVTGAEYTDTRGNNVSAQEDVDANNTGGFRPDGGASLNFDFPLDLTQSPSSYQSAAIANLFYWNNLCHDLHLKYGFTEAAGNFQTMNYTGLGLGNDAVQADAQDGSGTNNANFSTPPDGSPGRMQMYLFNYTSPNRDGDLESMIMVHEYGHGVSNRLTGGPANASALTAAQSGGMGEGWSDWWGLMFTQKPADTQTMSYPVGTYVLGQSTSGAGIRRYPYAYDMTKDPETIAYYNSDSAHEVHNTGELWCTTLWDLNWLLINKYGYNSNLAQGYTGASSAGNILGLKLVMDALKIQPANPSFKDARDAILQADQVLTGGANAYEIWTAFARRGMGASFVDSSSSATSVTPAYDLPASLLAPSITGQSPTGVSTTPVSIVDLTFSLAMDTTSFDITSDVVSFTGPTGANLKSSITSYSWINSNMTLRLNFAPTTGDGLYTLTVGPNILSSTGKLMDQNHNGTAGEPGDTYAAAFRYDALVGQVVSTVPAALSVVSLPMTTLDLVFNENITASSVDTTDLTVNQGTVVGAIQVAPNTARYTLSGVISEGTLSVSLAAGAVTDTYGNPESAYTTTYSLDAGVTSFPTPMTGQSPSGSLIYTTSANGTITTADTDSFTLLVNPGQTIAVLVKPTTGTLWPQVQLLDPNNTVIGTGTATAAGQNAMIQAVPTTSVSAGTFTVVVSGAGGATGGYTVQLVLNAALEAENNLAGTTDDSLLTAQTLDGAVVPLPGIISARRGALIGGNISVSPGTWNDYYSINLVAGDSLTVGLKNVVGSGATLSLLNASGTMLANGTSAANLDQVISQVSAAASGTYYLKVSGQTASTYDVVLSLNAAFDTEFNDTFATAQNISGLLGVQGSLQSGASSARVGYYTDNNSTSIGPVAPIALTGYTAVAISNIATFDLSTIDILMLDECSNSAVSSALSARLASIQTWVQSGGIFMVHDRFVSAAPNPFLLGASGATAHHDTTYGTDLNIIPPGGTLVTNGPFGTITDTTLDGGSSSDHGWVDGPTLPAATTKILSAGTDSSRVATLSYHLGSGTVYYSTIPLDFYLDGSGTLATTMKTVYTPNMLTYGNSQRPVGNEDWYALNVTGLAGLLSISTQTPGDGTGNFHNSLNPHIELYDPSGAKVASGATMPDGRNELILYQPLVTGVYRVRVTAESSTLGEYVLSLQPQGLAVVSSTPSAGATITAPPASFVINFSDPIDPASLSPMDLLVNATPADGVALSVDGKSATFTFLASPITNQGLQSMSMAAGAVTMLSDPSKLLNAFGANFRYDAVALQAISTVPGSGGAFTLPGPFTYDVNFNEAVDPATVQTSDLVLTGISGASVSGVSMLPGNTTVRFTIGGISAEGSLATTIAAGAINDAFGNPSLAFTGTYAVDAGTVAYPTPLTAVNPLGSMIYDPLATGSIGTVGDTDTFTVALDAGQTVTVLVTPSAGLQPNVQLLDPTSALLGSATASAAGQNALLQTLTATSAGTYSIIVGGAAGGTGTYSLQLILNAAQEEEGTLSAVSNATLSTAQVLDSGLTTLGGTAARTAVLGTVSASTDVDYYRITLLAGDTLSMALKNLGASTVTAQLYNAAGMLLANAPAGPTNMDRVFTDFAAPASGSYFIAIGGTASSPYALVLSKNAEFNTEANNTLAQAQDVLSRQVGGDQWAYGHVGASGDAADIYKVNLGAGGVLNLQTFTPGDGTGEFVNSLNPRLRILDAGGTQVALDDNGAPDGRNALLSFTNAGSAATFYVEVSSTTATTTQGEYVLRLNGNVPTLPVFQATTVNPANGTNFRIAPTSVTIDFNDSFLQTTIAASDLKIDGVSATAFTIVDGDTLTFTIPSATASGTHTLSINAGDLTDLQGTPIAAFSSTFLLDLTGPRVTAMSPAPNTVVATGGLSIQVTFNEAMAVSNLSSDDFSLVGSFRGVTYTASSYSFNAGGTIATFNYAGLPEDNYNFTLVAGSSGGTNFTDALGNALDGEFTGIFPSGNGTVGGNFVAGILVDNAASAFPTPLTSQAPVGSLIYAGTASGIINSAADADSFTINLDAGQKFTVVAHPVTATLRPAITVTGPDTLVLGSATAATANQDAVIQTLTAASAGTYTIAVSSAGLSTGMYTLQLTLNAAVEAEQHNGPTNDTLATAQNLDSAMVSVAPGASVGSVLGTLGTTTSDYFAFTLSSGQNVTFVMARLTGGNTPTLSLYDPSGNLLALGSSAPTNVQASIDTLIAPASGTYFARVSGSSMDYSLTIALGAAFNLESNDTIATAQNPGSTANVLGYVGAGSGLGRLYVYENAGDIKELNPLTGAVLRTFAAPTTTSAGPDFGLATTSTTLLAGGSPSSPIYELNPDTGAVIRTIANPSIGISGLAFMNNEIFALTDAVAGRITVLDYATGAVKRTITASGVAEGLGSSGTMLYGSTGGSSLYRIDPTTGATTLLTNLTNSSNVEGVGVINSELFVCNYNVVDVYDLGTLAYKRTFSTGIADMEGVGADGGGVADEDVVALNVTVGLPLQLCTYTPDDGTGEFVNALNPMLELYDSSGIKVASDDNSAPDGRNALLNFTPAYTGIYYAKVKSTTALATAGEYVLNISGTKAAAAPLTVTAVAPTSGASLVVAPTQATLTFSSSILLSTLQAGDLRLDGTPLTGLTVTSDHTAVFTLPAMADGTHTLSISAGEVNDIHNNSVSAFSSTFSLDTTPPTVIGSSIAAGDVRAPGALTLAVTFNRPMLASNLDATDFTLKGNLLNLNYTAASFAYSAGNTVLTLTYANLPEDAYTATLLSGDGRFEDTNGLDLDGEYAGAFPTGNGVAGGNFAVNFSLDAPLASAFPTLASVAPLGSLIYAGTTSSLILTPADTDSYTIQLSVGQQLTLAVHPATTGFRPVVTLRDPAGATAGSATAGTASDAMLQTILATTTGAYTIVISSAVGVGGYALQAVLNGAVEAEAHGGLTNDTLATAQNIDSAFAALPGGGSRAGIVGTATSGPLLSADFENGIGGFTVSNGSTGLWHLSTGRGTQSGHTATHALYYGQNETAAGGGNYSTGVANSGWVTSPSVSLPAGASITLDFNYVLQTENSASWDYSWLQVSNNSGSTWTTLSTYNGVAESTSWRAATTVSLAAYAGQTVQLRWLFNTVDSVANTYEGWYVDDIKLQAGQAASSPDYYAVSLAAGQSVSAALTRSLAGAGTLGLYNASNSLLAAGLSTTSNVSNSIDNFVAPSTGTYYLRYAGASSDYSLVVTKDAAFDLEPNDSPVAAQALGSRTSVLGFVQGTVNSDYFAITAHAGDSILLRSYTPGDTAGTAVSNALDPALEIYDPASALVAANDNAASDGHNAGLAYTALQTGTYVVRVRASTSGTTFGEYVLESHVDAAGTVLGRSIFYAGSSFDTGDPSRAIATDKSALLPGQTASFVNYTSYTGGINGIFVDIDRSIATLSPADFGFKMGGADPRDVNPALWAAAPAPKSIVLLPGAGRSGSTRVELLWDDNLIQNQWLQMTVLANSRTGLSTPDVFYFGSAIGESGDSSLDARITAADELGARVNATSFLTPATIQNHFDFNRDGSVNAIDQLVARANHTDVTNALQLLQAPPATLSDNPPASGDAAFAISGSSSPSVTIMAITSAPSNNQEGSTLPVTTIHVLPETVLTPPVAAPDNRVAPSNQTASISILVDKFTKVPVWSAELPLTPLKAVQRRAPLARSAKLPAGSVPLAALRPQTQPTARPVPSGPRGSLINIAAGLGVSRVKNASASELWNWIR